MTENEASFVLFPLFLFPVLRSDPAKKNLIELNPDPQHWSLHNQKENNEFLIGRAVFFRECLLRQTRMATPSSDVL